MLKWMQVYTGRHKNTKKSNRIHILLLFRPKTKALGELEGEILRVFFYVVSGSAEGISKGNLVPLSPLRGFES